LDLLVFLDESDREGLIKSEILYPLLDCSETKDGSFFQEVKKYIPEDKLNGYKEAYIHSMLVISELHVNNKNEKHIAYYTEKNTAQKMLLL
jgi:hypothetical protein